MKKISLKKLEALEKEGWEVSKSDKNAMSTQLGVTKAAIAIAVSLENIKVAIDKAPSLLPKTENIGLLLDNHYKLVSDLINVEKDPVEWEFDVKRKNGFIDKVMVKQING
jgi:hypothetical protein